MALAAALRRCTGISSTTYPLQPFTKCYYTAKAHRKIIQREKPKDLYAILNVSPYATQKQVKDAYYTLSMKYHPDRNEGSAEAHQEFTTLTEAYSIIGRYDRRKKYDKGLLHHYPERHHHPSSSSHAQERKTRFTDKKTDKTKYNFDEFYRAHYGDALERQRAQKRKNQADRVNASYYDVSEAFQRMTIVGIAVVAFVLSSYFQTPRFSETENNGHDSHKLI